MASTPIKGPRGVRKTIWTPEIVRQRIRTSQIVRALIEHTLGNREMVPSQVSAGLGLLRKVMPDLTATTLSAHIEQVDELSTQELARRISALEGAAQTQRSSEQPTEVH
jgi:hypothetical protein